MEYKLTRSCCKPDFDRTPLNQINDISSAEVNAVVDQVEIMGNFRKRKKKAKCCAALWLIVLVLSLVSIGVRHHRTRESHHRYLQEMNENMEEEGEMSGGDEDMEARDTMMPPPPMRPFKPRHSMCGTPEMSTSIESVFWRFSRTHMRKGERAAFWRIVENNKKTLPKEIFNLADDKRPNDMKYFGNYFKNEMRSIYERRSREHKGWFSRFRGEHGERERNEHNREGNELSNEDDEEMYGEDYEREGKEHHRKGKEHHRKGKEHHRKGGEHHERKEHRGPTDQEPQEAPEGPDRLLQSIPVQPKTGIPSQYMSQVHTLLENQRNMDLEKFNIMLKKERMVTFVTLMHFTHKKKCCGFLVFWILLPFLVCCCSKKRRKKLSKRINKILDIQNKIHYAHKGYSWKINKKLTELTLTRTLPERLVLVAPQVRPGQQVLAPPPAGYMYFNPFNAPHLVAPQHVAQQAPIQRAQPGDVLMTDRSVQPQRLNHNVYPTNPIGGYKQISQDDSSINYSPREYR